MSDRSPEWAEYESVLSSRLFSSQTNSTRFLKYVCAQHFAGTVHVSESEIAVQVLGRRADFNPQQDSIVRVEAHRVRKRLDEYYAREGSDHHLRLVLPQGKYLPQFLPAMRSDSSIEDGDQTKGLDPGSQASENHGHGSEGRGVWQWRRQLVWASMVALFLGSMLAIFHFQSHWTAKAQSASGSPAPQPAFTPDVLIMAGSTASTYTDQLAHAWSADRYFNGGQSWKVRYRRIRRTEDSQLFLTARQGQDFSYDIPLPSGFYELRLYFAETFYGEDNSEGGGESSRMFDVTANGVPLLTDFDPLSDAGGSNTADVRVFAGLSPAADGKLHIRFRNHWQLKGVAFVNAIQITRNDERHMSPIRWVASNSAIEDHEGRLWVPDQFVEGGRRRELREVVDHTSDPELYKSERYGNFSYAIPVVTGETYTLTLHFAEHWFGIPNYDSTPEPAIGKRVFDLACNQVSLAQEFDISREAGGSLKAVSKTFRGLRPNRQGKILLSFVPDQDYASVTALELTAEE